MDGSDVLLKPSDCALLLVDFQAGLGFGVESMSRQAVLNNAVAPAKTAIAFHVPVVASTSASRVYSGPMFPALQAALPFPLVSNQVEIHLLRLDCFEDGTLDQCLGKKMSPLAWSPLAGGRLTAALNGTVP